MFSLEQGGNWESVKDSKHGDILILRCEMGWVHYLKQNVLAETNILQCLDFSRDFHAF